MDFIDATNEEIEREMQLSQKAFLAYRKLSLKRRADFMRAIANELEVLGDKLLEVCSEETNLPEKRLRNERGRTISQLIQYADACESGAWLEARIDTANQDKTPPRPDLRKMMIPLGPVVVFGASNFPFAYSTAGGDTACAFAAGCSVIVKAHPAHAQTSEIVAKAIIKAATDCNMPEGIFCHLHGKSFDVGKALVMHPHTKAVGFTGSAEGGKKLFDWANERKEPIPVFAEMGSVNPVFILPEKLKQSAAELATMLAGSVTLGVGQFCTNPGLIIGIESDELDTFIQLLGNEIKNSLPGTMLHTGIFKNYVEKRNLALIQEGVETVAVAETEPVGYEGASAIASTSGNAFLQNPVLHQEVFGPFSLVIRCRDTTQMIDVANNLEGQLTCTLMATENDFRSHEELVEAVKNKCGRFIYNNAPTGVEVCLAMHHGGPFPATTDSRFTSVGADGIKRFSRPICFQNWPDKLLPEELKDGNPLHIYRTINNEIKK